MKPKRLVVNKKKIIAHIMNEEEKKKLHGITKNAWVAKFKHIVKRTCNNKCFKKFGKIKKKVTKRVLKMRKCVKKCSSPKRVKKMKKHMKKFCRFYKKSNKMHKMG